MGYFFAYGARMSSTHMLLTSPNARAVMPGHLAGYRLEFNVTSREFGGGAANAVPDPQGKLWGVVWDVPDDELTGFDSWRGDAPSDTHGVDVEIVTAQGPVRARTMMLEETDGFVRPADAYLNMLHAGARAHGLPDEALGEIDRAVARPRPTTED